MKDSKNQIFKDAQITIRDQMIQWDANTIPFASISRFYAGERPKAQQPSFLLLMLIFLTAVGVSFPGSVFAAAIALMILAIIGLCELREAHKGVNIEISSGAVCTFLSEQEAFALKVCDLLRERLSDAVTSETLVIRFNGEGEIEKETEDIEETEEKSKLLLLKEKAGPQATNTRPVLAAADLMKLYENENEKESPDGSLLELIEETIPLVEENNRQEAKEKFAKFIEMGIICQCNELGLNALLDEIKSCVY